MKKKTIIGLLILAALIAVFFVSRGMENVERRTNLFRFSQADVVKVEFITPNPLLSFLDENEPVIARDTLVVELIRDEWIITSPRRLPVRESQADRFFENILRLTVSGNPVSESSSRRDFYQVDEAGGLQIAFFGRNDRELARIFYGIGQNPNFAYVRRQGENQIYQINNIFQFINPALNAWRDDRIVSFAQNQIQSITVNGSLFSYELIQQNDQWVLYEGEESSLISLPNVNLQRLLNGISNLRTNVFFDDEYETHAERLANPDLELFIRLTTRETVGLRIARIDDNALVLQRNEERETLYRITNAQFNPMNIAPSELVDSD